MCLGGLRSENVWNAAIMSLKKVPKLVSYLVLSASLLQPDNTHGGAHILEDNVIADISCFKRQAATSIPCREHLSLRRSHLILAVL